MTKIDVSKLRKKDLIPLVGFLLGIISALMNEKSGSYRPKFLEAIGKIKGVRVLEG